ncbi:MAG: hypothetical protein JSR51_11060 [Proteobacteria bacterium]|nr:hypothetical protein [Pseudomonadota bacterium]
MSYLERLKQIEIIKNHENAPDNEIPKVPKAPSDTFDTSVFARNQKNFSLIRSWLTEIGEPEADYFLVLSKCKRDPEALAYYLGLAAEHARAKRREKVLQILSVNPRTKRAIITDLDSDPYSVILTIAIRGVAISEMFIPKCKYDGLALLELIHDLDHATESNH